MEAPYAELEQMEQGQWDRGRSGRHSYLVELGEAAGLGGVDEGADEGEAELLGTQEESLPGWIVSCEGSVSLAKAGP